MKSELATTEIREAAQAVVDVRRRVNRAVAQVELARLAEATAREALKRLVGRDDDAVRLVVGYTLIVVDEGDVFIDAIDVAFR